MTNDTTAAPAAGPDLEAEELAAKTNVSLEEAKAIIRSKGHDRATQDGAAQELKTETASD